MNGRWLFAALCLVGLLPGCMYTRHVECGQVVSCGAVEGGTAVTNDGAYKLPFACPDLRPAEIQPTFNRTLQAQGWHVDNGGFGFLTYAKDDLRLTASFADEKAEPSQTPWVVEAFCCFGA